MEMTSATLRSIARGVIGGAIATAPMTAVMVGVHRQLPRHHQAPLPPQQVIEDLGSAAGAEESMPEDQKQPLVWSAHYTYGALMGAIYGGMIAHRDSADPLTRGVCFGLGVWGANYLLGLPAVGMRASAYRESSDRNAMMILSHVVWGGALGLLESSSLLRRSRL